MKFSSVPKALASLWHTKKIWRKPGKAAVLLFDRCGSEALLTYLDNKSVEILDIRGESLNLYVLFKCILHWKLSMINYAFQYLSCVKPSVALTFIDNNILFYQLKSHQKDLTTVFVQNGIRGGSLDVFMFLEKQPHFRNKYQVDYMLTLGNAVGQEYSKYIDGKVFPIGSFKNNLYQSKNQKQLKTVLFISQYTLPPSSESSPVWIYDDKQVFWKQLYAAEEFLLPLLQQYCLHHKLELKISMRNADPAEAEGERKYFISLLGDKTFELLEKSYIASSYDNIDSVEFVVSLESTMGLEALARGKKTAVFSLRGNFLEEDGWNFGFPVDLSDNGPFWTCHTDEREFKRVMDYITAVSDEEWEETRLRYISELMEYDPGNTRFIKLMREIGVPLKPEYEKEENIKSLGAL